MKELAETRTAVQLAYGLLWMMHVNKATPDGKLKSMARSELHNILTKDERAAGIEMARRLVAPEQLT